MARFIIRSIISTIVTMLLVSILLFVLIEVGSGDITVKILGVCSTPEQRASYRSQLGLDAPLWQRYVDWLVGNDWRVARRIGYPVVASVNPQTGEQDWWADVDGQLTVKEGHRIARAVERCLEEKVEDLDSVIVHVDPALAEKEPKSEP